MDSFELNKIIGAILGTLLFVMGVGFLAEAIYHPSEHGPGYALPEPEATADAGGAEPTEAAVPLAVLLASANAEEGAKAVKKCASCHNFGAGEPNKTGPGLYDVVDRLIGSHEGYTYSAILEEHKAKGDLWTYENLDAFLLSPKGFAPGTKMTFAGVKSPEERANILAYLQTLSAAPKPFPVADAAAAPAEEAAPATEAPAAEAPAAETPATTEAPAPAPTETPAPATTEAPAPATEAPAPATTEAPAAAPATQTTTPAATTPAPATTTGN